jgi:hypothetical protein
MRYSRILCAAVVALVLVAATSRADQATAEMDAVRDAIRANRKAVVTANLKLSDEEATKFWPLYEEYLKELSALQDRLAKVVEQYAKQHETLTDDEASNLTAAYVLEEEQRAKLRHTYLPRFAAVLPGKTLARLYQVENKFDAAVRYELAAAIPLVKQ